LHGYILNVPQEEQIAMVLKAASSEITEVEWSAWVERSVAPFAFD
jgi:prophage maintenance system killer protein